MTFNLPKFLRSVLLVLLLLGIQIKDNAVLAAGGSPVAILRSSHNVQEYQDQHLGVFEDVWQSILQTLGKANISFEEISDAEAAFGQQRIGNYKIIIIPELIDLPISAVTALDEYQKAGGKIMISDAGGIPEEGAKKLLQMAGVTIVKQSTTTEKRKLCWLNGQEKFVSDEFPIGAVIADFNPSADSTILARWQDLSGNDLGPAMVRKGNCLFISWSQATQGSISTNANLMAQAIENLSPGVSQQAAVQISFSEYEGIRQELDYLLKRTDETIKTAKQADLAVPFKLIQERYDAATKSVSEFDAAYHDRHFYEADQFLQDARRNFALAFALAMPVRPVEARCIWLDRGTIINCHNPAGMAALFDRLKSAGFNVVYFETNNAGFIMYPSTVGTQNPDTVGWDPLKCAIKEAHQRGMELHSWLWIFNVGNSKHNPIIGKPADYPGPVLSKYDFAWALQSANGSLRPPRQFEFWLDPSVTEAKAYIKNLITEVISQYPVDGIQLDYIRYPFNNRGSEMGFDWSGRTRFEKDTGLNLDILSDDTRTMWQAWKVQQISNFVHDVSTMVRQAKPSLRISAAVYAMPRRLRLNNIQQEWEVWVANGWVDTINPMTYVPTASELTTAASSVRESTADQSLVYPGLLIRQLDTAGLVEQLDSARAIGTLGTTMFAAAQLDDKKLNILKSGPYRRDPIMTPQSEPVRASRILIDDFANLVNRYLHAPHHHILSDQASTNEVLYQIEKIQKQVHQLSNNATADQFDELHRNVSSLHESVKNWLRLEAFIQRGYRAQYIVNYLAQVEAILSYASHKAKCTNAPMTANTAASNS